ncbi:uncharacterized protein LOC111259733 [Varroa jacobsoni]|uniref:uncharacterized protein LOC111259733 n=1 Tax=Varroa jacobsoni TaxID=62625 RepID=UPI000BF7DAE8|nr:uncharacterized protein LOC111259733 [Varroa jacobsoni]
MPNKVSTKMRIVDYNHGRKLLRMFNKRRLDSHPSCDLRIHSCDSKEAFSAHKLIAAAACPYFDALLSSNFVDSKAAKVELPFSNRVISALLDYIYSGTVQFDNASALELLYAADFLMIDYLKGPIVNFICADLKSVFTEQNIESIGVDASLVVCNILKYYVDDDDVTSAIGDLLMTLEEKSVDSDTLDGDDIVDPLMNSTRLGSTKGINCMPSKTCVFRIFSNKLYSFDGFGWSRVFCPEFNEKAPSLKSFAVVDKHGKFLYHTQDELRIFEIEDLYTNGAARSPSDRSLKPFQEEILSTQSSRLCFSENTIMALFTEANEIEQQIHIWNDLTQRFQPFGDIWPLSITYLDYIFEDSVQGKSRLFVVGNFKTLTGEVIANSVFAFNLCPITGAHLLLSYKSIPVLPYINNSYIYHHFNGKLLAIPRTIGRNFCKDFYMLDENSATWIPWEEAKLKVENRTILDVVSTKDSLYLIMSNFDHRWQNEFVQWNGHEFTDVTFSTSIPIEGKLLERISWIDYNVVNKVLQKARGLWL